MTEKLFIAGHSLTDDPLGEELEAIARSRGRPLRFEEQILIGSSIRARTRGAEGTKEWSGLELGRNRRGKPDHLLDQLTRPSDGRPFDFLLVTERHDLALALVWEDTVRHLRYLHDRFVESNPAGRTFFYEPWLEVANKDEPGSWIAYEKAASKAWGCVTARVNATLGRASRADRITNVPVGRALAELIERATSPGGLPAFESSSKRVVIDRFLKDDVHPTELGAYYLALVSYAAITSDSLASVARPESLSDAQAKSLAALAHEVITSHANESAPTDLRACRDYFREEFLDAFWGYMNETRFARESGPLAAFFKRTKLALTWRWFHFTEGENNPLRDAGPWDDEFFFGPR